ncbi:predicted protein [Histoplasma capsulatum H143]|uniref:Uncharacterized protein n=1 Tax=Ajellomyces capsulatus (strain H143) TaxID=544712 RepID=C6HHJ8_AJECH|nr:predicted protein [Histoplasma capsulatum H143]
MPIETKDKEENIPPSDKRTNEISSQSPSVGDQLLPPFPQIIVYRASATEDTALANNRSTPSAPSALSPLHPLSSNQETQHPPPSPPPPPPPPSPPQPPWPPPSPPPS